MYTLCSAWTERPSFWRLPMCFRPVFLLYFAVWRRFLAPLRRDREVVVHPMYAAFLTWFFPFSIVLGSGVDIIVRNLFRLFTKIPFAFLSVPLMGGCLGSFIGRLFALAPYTREWVLMVVRVRCPGSRTSIRIYAVPKRRPAE